MTDLHRRLARSRWTSSSARRRRCCGRRATRLAEFIGGDPRRLVFTANVTAAVNLIASSLRLTAPGDVLLSDHEYGTMHWCWERAAQRQGLTVRTFPLPSLPDAPQPIVEAACAAMTERTRLLFFSHVLSPTGMVLPAPNCVPRHAGAAY